MISIGMPATVLPTSSAAICAAITEPWPPRSAYRPDMSLSTPMTSLLPPPPAGAAAGADPPAGAPDAGAPAFCSDCFLHAVAAHSAAAHRPNRPNRNSTVDRSAIRLGRWVNIAAPGFQRERWTRTLDTEIDAQPLHARRKIAIGDHVDHAPVLHDVVAVRDGLRKLDVLLDEEDREALGLEPLDRGPDLLDDH